MLTKASVDQSNDAVNVGTVDETSNDSSVLNLDRTKADVKTKFSDILTKDCQVVLLLLKPADLGKSHNAVNVTVEKEDTSDMAVLTDSGKETMSSSSFSDSDDIPLSQFCNKDRGRP